MTTTIQSLFPESFLEKVDNFWGLADQEQKKFKDKIFNVVKDKGNIYESLNRVGLGLPGISNELEPSRDDGPSESYKTTFVPQGITSRVSFSYEFTQRDTTMVASETLKDQRTVMEDACEYAAHSVFDNASSSEIAAWEQLGGDSVSLLNTAHPVSNGETQSNTGSVYRGISTSAVNSLIDRMATNKNDVGLPRPLTARGLICQAQRMTKAEQVVGAQFAIENSDDVPNVMGDHGVTKSGIIASPYIFDKDFWGLISNINMKQGFIFVDNIPLKVWKDYDSDRRVMYHVAYQAIAAGFVNWRIFWGYK